MSDTRIAVAILEYHQQQELGGGLSDEFLVFPIHQVICEDRRWFVGRDLIAPIEISGKHKSINQFLRRDLIKKKDFLKLEGDWLKIFKEKANQESKKFNKKWNLFDEKPPFQRTPALYMFKIDAAYQLLDYYSKRPGGGDLFSWFKDQVKITHVSKVMAKVKTDRQSEKTKRILKGLAIINTFTFQNNDLPCLHYDGRPCLVAVDLAKAAGLKAPRNAIYSFLKREDYLEAGVDYIILEGQDYQDFRDVVKSGVTLKVTPDLISPTAQRITLLFETGVISYIGQLNTKLGRTFRSFMWKDVVPVLKTVAKDLADLLQGEQPDSDIEKDLEGFVDWKALYPRRKQIELVKGVASSLFAKFGKEGVIDYHTLLSIGLTGDRPRLVRAKVREAGAPAKYCKSGREAIRWADRPLSMVFGLTDLLVSKDKDQHDSLERAKAAYDLICDLYEIGFFGSQELDGDQLLMFPVNRNMSEELGWVNPKALKNPLPITSLTKREGT